MKILSTGVGNDCLQGYSRSSSLQRNKKEAPHGSYAARTRHRILPTTINSAPCPTSDQRTLRSGEAVLYSSLKEYSIFALACTRRVRQKSSGLWDPGACCACTPRRQWLETGSGCHSRGPFETRVLQLPTPREY